MPRKNYPKKRKPTPYIAPKTLDTVPTLDIACSQKRRFPTEKQATYDAETRMLQDHHLGLKVYLCPSCRGWHLTRE